MKQLSQTPEAVAHATGIPVETLRTRWAVTWKNRRPRADGAQPMPRADENTFQTAGAR